MTLSAGPLTEPRVRVYGDARLHHVLSPRFPPPGLQIWLGLRSSQSWVFSPLELAYFTSVRLKNSILLNVSAQQKNHFCDTEVKYESLNVFNCFHQSKCPSLM